MVKARLFSRMGHISKDILELAKQMVRSVCMQLQLEGTI